MRLLEKEGIRSYGHVEHQEFSQRERRDRREANEPFNFANQEVESNGGNCKFGRLDLPRFNGEDPDG